MKKCVIFSPVVKHEHWTLFCWRICWNPDTWWWTICSRLVPHLFGFFCCCFFQANFKLYKLRNRIRQQRGTAASVGGNRLLMGVMSELSRAPGAIHFVNLSPVQTLRRRRNDQLGGEEGQSTSSDSQRNCATPTYTGVRLAHDSVGSCRWPQDKPSYPPDAHHPDSLASSLPLLAKKKKEKQQRKRKSYQ